MVNMEDLISVARATKMSEREMEEQRQSFAYGNAKIENDLITRETVSQQAQALKSK